MNSVAGLSETSRVVAGGDTSLAYARQRRTQRAAHTVIADLPICMNSQSPQPRQLFAVVYHQRHVEPECRRYRPGVGPRHGSPGLFAATQKTAANVSDLRIGSEDEEAA